MLVKPFGYDHGLGAKDGSPDGQLVFDANGQPVQAPAYKVLGNGIADWTGGINNSFTWKGINLSFLIDIKVGWRNTLWNKHPSNQWGRSEQIARSGVKAKLYRFQVLSEVTPMEQFEPFSLELTPDQSYVTIGIILVTEPVRIISMTQVLEN